DMPRVDYSIEDVRVATHLSRIAAAMLARAQRDADHARREQNASELSQLAGSLTQSLSVSAVCEQLVHNVLALVHGTGAVIWNSKGESMFGELRQAGILPDPRDPRLERMLEQVSPTPHVFSTPHPPT